MSVTIQYGKAFQREVLTAARTYYVRTDGSDSNSGLADTAGGAFLTINKALSAVQAIDISIYTVTIQVGTGTFTGAIALTNGWVGSGKVILQGDTTTPGNCHINVTGTSVSMTAARLEVDGFQITSTGNNFNLANGSQLVLRNMIYSGGSAAIRVTYDSFCQVSGANHTINGNYSTYLNGLKGSYNCFGATITLTGTPAFSTSFAFMDTLSYALMSSMTFSGSGTGKRYTVNQNSVLQTGGGATYLPGNSAGTVTTGGVYT